MNISINDIKNGMTIIIDGKLCMIEDFQHVKPGKGSAFMRIKLRNLRTGALVENTYNTNINVEKAHVNRMPMQFLYVDGNNYVFMNRWGENLGNKGIFKAKIDCLRNCVFYGIYHNIYCLTNEEKNYWEILKSNIKKATDEMNSIRCPICKRKAPIDKFYVKNNNKLICPFQEACVFDIRNNGDYEFEFIAEQIFYDKKNLFEFGFDLFK